MEYLALAFGLALLVVGANYFVEYAVNLARHMRLHVTVFGAVIVAIGTSLPELSVAVEAGFEHSPDIIVGTILGSNVANVGLVLGTALLLGSIAPNTRKLRGKSILLVVLSLIFISLLQLQLLSWPAGLILLALAGFLIFDMGKNRERTTELPHFSLKDILLGWAILAASLIGIIMGSQVAIDSALAIAHAWGISAGVIAATVIAVGTSLPELIVTITAARKRENGLAMGNIIGSNLFNIALIGGTGATLTSLNNTLSFTIAGFFLVFLALGYFLARGQIKPTRLLGVGMLCLYVIYVIAEYASA